MGTSPPTDRSDGDPTRNGDVAGLGGIRLEVSWRTSETGPPAFVPRYATDGSAGADLCAALSEPLTVQPGRVTKVPTGVFLAIPSGFEGQIRPRSGLAARHGVLVVNSPGTIDSDYRGEVQILLTTLADPYVISPGERIAQIVFTPVVRAAFLAVSELPPTTRGPRGFGHTGT